MHLVNEDDMANFMDVFTVSERVHKQVLAEPQSNPFRRDDGATLYTPPLPSWVLATLGTGTGIGKASHALKASVLVDGSNLRATPYKDSHMGARPPIPSPKAPAFMC